MINLEKLHAYQRGFGFFVQQLTYPEQLDFNPTGLEEYMDSSHPAYSFILQYWERMQHYSLEQLQELYVETFDFQRKSTLYMTYFKYEDSKERGAMLAELKSIYQLYGLDMMNEELPDYLPLMLEFLYAMDGLTGEQAQGHLGKVIAVLEDGTYHLVKALEQYKSPYHPLLMGLRETFKACVVKEDGVQ